MIVIAAPSNLGLRRVRPGPDPRCVGVTVTMFDPDLDPDGRRARTLVGLPLS